MNRSVNSTLEALRERLQLQAEKKEDPPFLGNLRDAALKNTAFRRIVYTGAKLQFSLMSIPPEGDVGKETHDKVEQVFYCVRGEGQASYDGRKQKFSEGDVLVVPPGVEHNILNTGSGALKFYTTYSPPNHPPDTVHLTKADAEKEGD